jgi:hypothetical protein
VLLQSQILNSGEKKGANWPLFIALLLAFFAAVSSVAASLIAIS